MSIYSDIEAKLAATFAADGTLDALVTTVGIQDIRPDQQDKISTDQLDALQLPAVLVDADRERSVALAASLGSNDYQVPVIVTTVVQSTVASAARTLLESIIGEVERIANWNCNSTNDWTSGGFVTMDAAVSTVKIYPTESGFVAYGKTYFTVLKNVNT